MGAHLPSSLPRPPAPDPRPDSGGNPALRAVVARLVPGTELRDGIDRILRARTGALIVLGYDESVEQICDGGFELDVEFSPTRLRELSKMDGAVVLSTDGRRLRRANVHLVPDPLLPTTESGTRHKAAERTAAQTGCPVVSVSRSTGIVTVYAAGDRHLIQPSETILSRANQAMATLERYRTRLDEMVRQLSVVELGDVVTVRDALTVVHCLELVRRVAREIDADVAELGVDGRQLAMQLAEVVGDTESVRRMVVRDYVRPWTPGGVDEAAVDRALSALDGLLEVELLELTNLAAPLGFPATVEALGTPTCPRGYRLLAEIPRIPRERAEALVAAFGSLSALLDADIADLTAVDGIDAELARQIREALARTV
ncbi:DNA integrity scanning diadenylate cyclase DisA [Nocardia transvalensis]|uniref:DNA integrity scanning diadenylate cyclase DisA n=1 Tax=Nocardia transvalensis TaxID=37333 RepID=UPI001893AECA|nr:DNA integrity scanning diadenylate cyclase DisA [Nocardia transvalensis]MBF6332754.1 DNA integrity scanning protein DisA [Nocardia transvalensis]